jgi:hypothetical protein
MAEVSNPVRRAGLVLVSLGALSLAACVVAPYPVRRGRGPVQPDPDDDGPVVDVEPPPPLYEAPVPPPAVGYVWIGGYWNWVGARHVWVRGYWAPPRVGLVWVPHRWVRYGRGWRMTPGSWRRG